MFASREGVRMKTRNFAAERERLGMTQAQVAEALGVCSKTVSRYEQSMDNITLEMLVKAADLFGCTTDYLLGRTERRR